MIENQRLYKVRGRQEIVESQKRNESYRHYALPACLRKDLITRLHNHNLHNGSNLLTLKLQGRYFWPEIWKDAKENCLKCDICMRAKKATDIKKEVK